MQVIAVDRDRTHCVTDTGAICRFTNWLDETGEETDAAQAVVAIAEHPNGQWLMIDLRCFGQETMH